MAKSRLMKNSIWDDPTFEKYTMYGKLLFVYLCNNTLNTESGVYPISLQTMSFKTSIPLDQIKPTLQQLKNISYDFEHEVVFVKNFLRYNGGGNPILRNKSIKKDMETINTPLWDEFAAEYPDILQEVQNVEIATYSTKTKKRNKSGHTPTKEMFRIYLQIRNKHRTDTYRWMPWDGKVAQRLYKMCLLDNKEDPLGYFCKKVEGLMEKFPIDQFGGIERFWNQINVLKDTTSHPLLDTDYKTGFQEI